MIIEVMLHSLDILIILMSFSCHEDDISLLCHCASGLDSLLSVGIHDDVSLLLFCESSQHIIDDIHWLLISWIVRRDDNLITVSDSRLRHDRTLAFITITTAADHCDQL